MKPITRDTQEICYKWFISFNFDNNAMDSSEYLHISTYPILNQLSTILREFYVTNIL